MSLDLRPDMRHYIFYRSKCLNTTLEAEERVAVEMVAVWVVEMVAAVRLPSHSGPCGCQTASRLGQQCCK